MDLKELCKEVDRIAILERREPDMATDKRKTVKKRSRSGNASRYVVYQFFCVKTYRIIIIYCFNKYAKFKHF